MEARRGFTISTKLLNRSTSVEPEDRRTDPAPNDSVERASYSCQPASFPFWPPVAIIIVVREHNKFLHLVWAKLNFHPATQRSRSLILSVLNATARIPVREADYATRRVPGTKRFVCRRKGGRRIEIPRRWQRWSVG